MDDAVDLSIKRPSLPPPTPTNIPPPPKPPQILKRKKEPQQFINNQHQPRRSLRPRTERSYAESPDIIIDFEEEPPQGGYNSDDSDYGEMPPEPKILTLTALEQSTRNRHILKLKAHLRNEEMKLVLLKKLRQSQMMKENLGSVPNTASSQNAPHRHLQALNQERSTPSAATTASAQSQSQNGNHVNLAGLRLTSQGIKLAQTQDKKVPSLLKGQPVNRGLPAPNIMMPPRNLIQHSLLRAPSPSISPSVEKYERPKEAHSSVSIQQQQAERRHRLQTHANPPSEEETPAQKQAAAKLALRKQLEKTLLQIPPPKPPPPEMNFIPNGNNGEFLALIGLEFVVDYITDKVVDNRFEKVNCGQCRTDFSAAWRVEKGKPICSQCTTTNAKKSLKAEHTNRLKTAFVQALQQEQEIEQRLEDEERSSPNIRNRTPAQSPGKEQGTNLVVQQQQRSREREMREREQAQQAQAQQQAQHSFTQQLRSEMAQLAQLHEQHQLQLNQQRPQPSKPKPSSSSSSASAAAASAAAFFGLNLRSDKKEQQRDYRLDSNFGLAHLERPQNLGRSERTEGRSEGKSRRRQQDSFKQQQLSKQQKHDMEAAAKFATAMGMNSINPAMAQAAAQALQAAQHQMMRMPSNQLPAHLLHFNPLLYPYQMAMAQQQQQMGQQAQAQQTPAQPKQSSANLAELHRQAENLQQLQRQYLLDMIPNSRQQLPNWKP